MNNIDKREFERWQNNLTELSFMTDGRIDIGGTAMVVIMSFSGLSER